MNNVIRTFLLACSVLLGGCSQSKQIPEDLTGERQPPEITPLAEDAAPERAPADVAKIPPEGLVTEQEPPGMIQIQNLTLTEKTLTLDYRVSNPFEDDIRVCRDTAVYGNQDAQYARTRIYGETIRIILGRNVETAPVLVDPRPVAKYVRLAPGESCSGKILLNLPIIDDYPEPLKYHKEHKEVVLHRAVLEVGYFGPKSNEYFEAASERIKWRAVEPRLTVDGPYYYLSSSPTITEEVLDGKLRDVIYVHRSRASRKDEEYVEVPITNIDIPCSVVVEDE